MSDVNMTDSSLLRDTNFFDLNNVKEEKFVDLDAYILLGLAATADTDDLSIPKIKTIFSSIDNDIKEGIREGYDKQIVTTLPTSITNQSTLHFDKINQKFTLPKSEGLSNDNLRSFDLKYIKLDDGFYTLAPNTEGWAKPIKAARAVPDNTSTNGKKVFSSCWQRVMDSMQRTIDSSKKQSVIGNKRKMTKRLRSGPPIPQLGRRLQKRTIPNLNVASRNESLRHQHQKGSLKYKCAERK